MIVNPYRELEKLKTFEFTRILQQDFGLTGVVLQDLYDPARQWTITRVLAPILGRFVGGVRVKLVDNKQFITYCNQRDLEVLLGIGVPGKKCLWGVGEYVEPGDREWHGLTTDFEDLLDDLQDRELELREQCPGGIPPGLQIERRIHLDDPTTDVIQLDQFLWDMDPETGISPDGRIQTIAKRWSRVQRDPVGWEYVR